MSTLRKMSGIGALVVLPAFWACAADTTEKTEPDARAIMQAMAQQLATAPGYNVTINSRYEAIQTGGENIEFAEKRQVHLQRPSQLRIDMTRSDGDNGMILFDGQTITVYKAKEQVYSQAPVAGTVDNAVMYVLKDLQLTVPLARMLVTTLPDDLDIRLTTLTYVEKNVLLDVPVHHIAGRSPEVDIQLWITASEPVVPRRVVITYKNEPGQPQFRADLENWDFKPLAGDVNPFAWTVPAGTEKVVMLAPVPTAEASRTQQAGGVK